MIKIINTEEEFEEVLKEERAIVDFNAEWCSFCKIMEPILENVSKKHKDVKIYSVNVDNLPSLAEEYGVRFLPNFVIFENGKVTDSKSGGMEEEEFLKFALKK